LPRKPHQLHNRAIGSARWWISHGRSAPLHRGECLRCGRKDSFFGKLPEILAAMEALARRPE
jgi:hypothetical protein